VAPAVIPPNTTPEKTMGTPMVILAAVATVNVLSTELVAVTVVV
jgi:hypothetical protein